MGTQSQLTAAAAVAYARPAFGASTAPIRAERRTSRRYSLDLAACYEFLDQAGKRISGNTRVLDISSGGALLYSEHSLVAGQSIRVRIDWPAMLNGIVPLALHIEGRAVRTDRNRVAVRILKSEFRTRSVGQAPLGSAAVR